jgi:hypothetical protein
MKTCSAHCKFCDKKYVVKSKWLPYTFLDLSIDFQHFFHMLKHHRKEFTFKSFSKAVWTIIKRFLISLGVGLLIIFKCLLYPLYLLLALIYE